MKCIICKNEFSEDDFDDEHVFPESIGGEFPLENMVCKTCNHHLGSKVDRPFVNNFLIEHYRYRFSIANKKGVVPNPYKNGAAVNNPDQKINWDPNNGTLYNFPIKPVVKFRDDGALEISASVDESSGEEALFEMIQKTATRNGKQISIEDIKENSDIRYVEDHERIEYTFTMDLFEYYGIFVKIAYELASYWLGNIYLNDPTGNELRKFLYEFINNDLTPQEALSKHNIKLNVGLVNNEPDFEIPNQKNSHCALIFKDSNSLNIYINIFNVFQGTVRVSENSKLYPSFKNKLIILNFKEKNYKEVNWIY